MQDGEGRSIMDLLRPEIVSIGEGRAEMRFASRPEFTIPGGSIQGGIIAAMLDMTMAFAVGGRLATASFHCDILRPPRQAVLVVTGRIVQAGRRIVFAEAEMKDEEGRVVARGSQTAVPL